MAFQIRSSAFKESQMIPTRFTKDGQDVSPPFSWTDAPEGTKEFILVCEDPDAHSNDPFIHWVASHIPAEVHAIPEGLPKKSSVRNPVSLVQGSNSFGDVGYGGPRPPRGDEPHHYHFKLYALDTELKMDADANKDSLEKAMAGHVLAEAEIVGLYQRH